MHLRIVTAISFWLVLSAVPLRADVLYENGDVNGHNNAWTINYGFAVTDSILVNGSVQGIGFWTVMRPGDQVTSVQVTISEQVSARPGGATRVVFNQIVPTQQTDCFQIEHGDLICLQIGSFNGPRLHGVGWITLQNAINPNGNPVYWDENSGAGCMSQGCPSRAYENYAGTIPSESFSIYGTRSSNEPTTGSLGIWLLGLGAVAFVSIAARKRL
jgi:hypothetical protein